MRILLKIFLLLAITLTCGHALALPADVTATAAVSCTVDDIMEWEGNFTALGLDPITAQGTIVTKSGTATLYTNGDVHITANNAGTTARLTLGSDFLVTQYSLGYDGNGSTTGTGGDAVDYTGYATFLSTPSVVTHVTLDGAVVVTLTVKAYNQAGDVANAGLYEATQTLTASWGTGA
jgi:hypothetical protein